MSKRRKNVILTKKATKIIRCGNIKCTKKLVVDVSAVSGLCSRCVQDMVPSTHSVQKPKSDKPVGWKFMSEFVDADGTVYHRGEEQPKLKGTLPISDVEKIKADQKKRRIANKKKKEKAAVKKEERLVKTYEKKQKALKKEKIKKESKEVKPTKKPVIKKAVKKKSTSKKRVYSKSPKITQSIINKMAKMYKKENNRITSNMIKKLGYDKYRIKATLRTAGVYGQQGK